MTIVRSAALVAAVVALSCLGPTSTVIAQDVLITGPLAGQPAVRRMRQYRAERVQLIVPTVGFTLQDEFARSLMVGLEANFHFTDFLGIGIYGAMANFANAFQIDTDLTSQIIANGQTTSRNRLSMPDPDLFGSQVARMLGLASVHLLFAPLRGKLALFQGAFVDTDFYILAGFTAAFVEERAPLDAGGAAVCNTSTTEDACRNTQTAREVRFAPAPMFGVGLNLYFTELIGLALQWRGFPYDWNPSGTDESGRDRLGNPGGGFADGLVNDQDQRFYFHHMINIGLIINLPPDAIVSE